MPKKRLKTNKGLPEGWRFYHGAYRYRVPKGKEALWGNKTEFTLGKTLADAHIEWIARVGDKKDAKNISEALDKYLREESPLKAPETARLDAFHSNKVRIAFGHMPIASIEPFHIYQYFQARDSKVSAKREIALLSHLLTKCVEWGYIKSHTFKGNVRLKNNKARTRILEQWEIDECLAMPVKNQTDHQIKAYLVLKGLISARRVDILRIKITDATDKGIAITPSKTENSSGKSTIYLWTAELKEAWDKAIAVRPVNISPWLFCNHKGQCYIDEAIGKSTEWAQMWRVFMDRVIKHTNVKERFTESDIRSKAADDSQNLDHARALLSHSSTSTTNRIYRRKAEEVKPTK